MNLTTFKFNSTNVRTVTDSDGNPWFVAAEVFNKALEDGVLKKSGKFFVKC